MKREWSSIRTGPQSKGQKLLESLWKDMRSTKWFGNVTDQRQTPHVVRTTLASPPPHPHLRPTLLLKTVANPLFRCQPSGCSLDWSWWSWRIPACPLCNPPPTSANPPPARRLSCNPWSSSAWQVKRSLYYNSAFTLIMSQTSWINAGWSVGPREGGGIKAATHRPVSTGID